MKIEVGKLYKTRGGQKARIYAVDGCTGVEIHGAIEHQRCWAARTWCSDGNYFDDSSTTCAEDLISEWTDPPQKKKLYAYLKISNTCFYTLGYFDKEDPSNGLRCPSRDLEVEV